MKPGRVGTGPERPGIAGKNATVPGASGAFPFPSFDKGFMDVPLSAEEMPTVLAGEEAREPEACF